MKILCLLFGHQYRVLRRMNPGTRKVGCDRCEQKWAMHDGTQSFIPWNEEVEEFYAPDGILNSVRRHA